MADPVTIGIAVASTAFEVIGSMQQAAAQEEYAQQQQQIYEMQAEQNRIIAERNAEILRAEGEYNALALKAEGKAKQADAQRDFIRLQHDKRLALSRLIALSGASGAGVGDPTVLDIGGDIEQIGQFTADSALFYGDTAAQLLFNQADLTLHTSEQQAELVEYQGTTTSDILRYQGESARYIGETQAAATRTAAIGKAIGGAGSLYAKYGPEDMGGGPGTYPGPEKAPPPPKPTYYGRY